MSYGRKGSLKAGEVPGSIDAVKELANGIRVLIDDDERHVRGTELPNLKRILLKCGYSEPLDVPEGIELARSWDEVLRIVRGELFADG